MYQVKALPVPRQAGFQGKRALVESLAKIDARITGDLYFNALDEDQRDLADKAFYGSTDAFFELIDAVLPGWIGGADTTGFAHVWKDESEITHSHSALCVNPSNPARAGLCAILIAMIVNTIEPTMILSNGDVLVEGDWGVTRHGRVAQVFYEGYGRFPWFTDAEEHSGQRNYMSDGRYVFGSEHSHDIIARAPAPIQPRATS